MVQALYQLACKLCKIVCILGKVYLRSNLSRELEMATHVAYINPHQLQQCNAVKLQHDICRLIETKDITISYKTAHTSMIEMFEVNACVHSE